MTYGALHPRRRWLKPAVASLLSVGLLAIGTVASSATAGAAAYENSVGLGTAASYSVLAGSTVTNTGSSVLGGDLGLSPNNAITGFPPGLVGGATNNGNAASALAEGDLTTAYLDAAGRAPTGTNLGSALVGTSLLPGVYNAASSLGVSGAVTLDGQGDPNAVFVFQIGAALTTATSTSIVLTGAAQACNVFWQVGSSATLGTTNTFVGTVMALTSISIDTGTTVAGRALARNGAVTLDDNVFTQPTCATTPTTTSVTATAGTTGGTSTLTATVAAAGANAPTGTVTFSSNGVAVGTSPIGSNGVATLTVPAGTTAGTRSITAHFNGLLSYGTSTSTATNLVVTAAPATPVKTGTTTTLASTGPEHTTTLSLIAAALLLSGIGLMVAGRNRRTSGSARAGIR
jgi:LPXTG-motif cell wall-anchored protein